MIIGFALLPGSSTRVDVRRLDRVPDRENALRPSVRLTPFGLEF